MRCRPSCLTISVNAVPYGGGENLGRAIGGSAIRAKCYTTGACSSIVMFEWTGAGALE